MKPGQGKQQTGAQNRAKQAVHTPIPILYENQQARVKRTSTG